ncbi:hypothetical protein J6590_054680 [Homalodisca vitripennis]|nr:hypothetical protein J6590_054680 [Homalodisca vitripennis]
MDSRLSMFLRISLIILSPHLFPYSSSYVRNQEGYEMNCTGPHDTADVEASERLDWRIWTSPGLEQLRTNADQ